MRNPGSDRGDIAIEDRDTESPVEATVQAGQDPRTEAVSHGEGVQVQDEFAHRGEEHHALDRRTVRHGEGGGLGAKGMPDDGAGRPVGFDESLYRAGAFDNGGASRRECPRFGIVVAR
jgi:hypothetical protein